jgi:hypothetical protein
MHDETKAALAQAFKAMREAGLVARQNFSCCQNCATYDLAVYMKENPGKHVGYAYYHSQDGAKLNELGNVYIAYGSEPEGDDKANIKIGSMVADALRAAKLDVAWDGDVSKRIFVRGMQGP